MLRSGSLPMAGPVLWATTVTSVLVGRSSELEELHVKDASTRGAPSYGGGTTGTSLLRRSGKIVAIVAYRSAMVGWHTRG